MSNRHRRTTLVDVAEAAGVSLATVDRVLNHRPGVSPRTMERVEQSLVRLGYRPDPAAVRLARGIQYQFCFVLPSGTNTFMSLLASQVDRTLMSLAEQQAYGDVLRVDVFDPQGLASTLRGLIGRYHGVATVALDHPVVRDAVGEIAARGIPVLTMISDIPETPRTAYVGLDNRAAGRTAGLLIGRFVGERRGKVALIAGSRSYRAHEERELGFLGMIAEAFPALTVVGLREGHDDAVQNYRQTRALLAKHPDIVGIYNIGGASDGITRALREANRGSTVTFVGHGLTPDTHAALRDGTMDVAITQDHQMMTLNCVRIFTNLRDGRAAMSGIEPMQISLFVRENLS